MDKLVGIDSLVSTFSYSTSPSPHSPALRRSTQRHLLPHPRHSPRQPSLFLFSFLSQHQVDRESQQLCFDRCRSATAGRKRLLAAVAEPVLGSSAARAPGYAGVDTRGCSGRSRCTGAGHAGGRSVPEGCAASSGTRTQGFTLRVDDRSCTHSGSKPVDAQCESQSTGSSHHARIIRERCETRTESTDH